MDDIDEIIIEDEYEEDLPHPYPLAGGFGTIMPWPNEEDEEEAWWEDTEFEEDLF